MLDDIAGHIAERYQGIDLRIEEACRLRGRRREEVVLVGASKTQPPEALAAAWRAGLRVFGENRVQEALAKSRELSDLIVNIEWHLIGPLQTNKVKAALDLFRTIHSVDRLRVAEALDQEAGRRGLRLSGFLEVNLGGEASKHGFPAEGLAEAVRPLADLQHLKIAGLMAIPPQSADSEGSRPWFRRLRELRDELASRPEWPDFPGWLSMGMSHDFDVAVEEGATHVRVGTLLFGSRG
jgi:pyridoxal phosphate enzyme (YggS family)